MDILYVVVLVVNIVSALGVIGLVLMQHGKGADMGAAFGSGASGSLFGSTGSANFLSRTTALLAAVFFATSLALAYIASHRTKTTGSAVLDAVKSQAALVPAPISAPTAAPGAKTETPADSDSKTKDIPK